METGAEIAFEEQFHLARFEHSADVQLMLFEHVQRRHTRDNEENDRRREPFEIFPFTPKLIVETHAAFDNDRQDPAAIRENEIVLCDACHRWHDEHGKSN